MWQPWLSSSLAPGHHHQMRVSVHYKHMNVSQHLQYLNGSHVDGTSQKRRTWGHLLYFPLCNLLLIYVCFICASLELNCTLVAELQFQE